MYTFRIKANVEAEDISLFRRIYGNNKNYDDFLNAKYKSAIEGLKKTKGILPDGIVYFENYSEEIWEGLSTEEYIKEYPLIYHSDGYMCNYKE